MQRTLGQVCGGWRVVPRIISLHADLEAYGEGVFNAAVLNMVVMDMPDIGALASGLRCVLKVSPLQVSSGSIMHTP